MLDIESRVMRKVNINVLLLTFLCMALNYIDRVNLGFAALTMNEEIGLDAVQFGLGAGVFFVSYAILEIPSNLALHRFGANIWISRILVSCGITATLMAAIQGPHSYYLVRFLFGAAEAGLIPGIMLYLSYWYPQKHKAFAYSIMTAATGVVGIIAGPYSSLISENLHGVWGLSGWRWMFIFQGVPVAIVGLIIAFVLSPRPQSARWLTDEEKRWLIETLDRELPTQGHSHVWDAFRNPKVWLLASVYFLFLVAIYGLQLWLPQIIRSAGQTSNVSASMLSAGPPVIALILAIILGKSSDRMQERRWHLSGPLVLGGILLVISTQVPGNPILGYALFCCAWGLLFAPLGIFWTISASSLSGIAAAAGLALINMIAQLGGFFGPSIIGFIREATGDFTMAVVFSGLITVATGLLALCIPEEQPTPALEIKGI